MVEKNSIKNIEIGKFYFIHDDMELIEEISKRNPEFTPTFNK